jgi:2'-5' RNA ligase
LATRYDQKERFIDVEYTVSPELNQLQMKVINALNDVRSNMRAKDKERMLSATGMALKNFQQYGYKPVGELFRPHITLTRFNGEPDNASSVLPDIATFNGTFDRLALFEMGDNGTCIRKIAEWGLTNNG